MANKKENAFSPSQLGFMVIPSYSKCSSTDGNHRIQATGEAKAKMASADRAAFEKDCVVFMLTLESDISQIHQDFADCSKTKPIQPAMLVSYDRRVPANGVVLSLIERCPVFSGKIDSTSKTIGKTSYRLFTSNQVRQLVKSLLTADIAMAEAVFVAKAADLLPESDKTVQEHKVDQYANFINTLTELVPAWKQAASFKQHEGPKIMELRNRSQSLLFTATGLNIAGCVAHRIFNEPQETWPKYIESFGRLNFDKKDPLWSDVLVPKRNKAGETYYGISTNRAPVERAVARALQKIGLDPDPERPQIEASIAQ